MSLLSTLAANINDEFKAVLPALNQVAEDMVKNYSAWQASPVVKATEAAVTLISPVASLDMQAAIGAASLVQALWQVYGAAPAHIAAQVSPVVTPVVNSLNTLAPAAVPAAPTITPETTGLIQEQSHM